MPTEITTPVGRMVWGGFKPRQKIDTNTKQPVFKDGKPVMQMSFGLAIQKTDFAPVWAVMAKEAMRFYPSGTFPPGFALKFADGDGIDSNGKPFAEREGYRGCYVLAISSELDPPPIMQLSNGTYVQVPADQMKTGYYYRVNLGIDAHGKKQGVPTAKEGLYLNPRLIEFVGYGAEIFNAPDAVAVFGGAAVALPPGASAIPVASAQPMPASAPMQPQPVAAAPVMPGMPAPAAALPPAIPAALPLLQAAPLMPIVSPSNPPPPPAHDFVAAATGVPAMPGMPQPAPAPALAPQTPQYTVPMGQPIPAGYRLISYSPDGKFQIVTTP